MIKLLMSMVVFLCVFDLSAKTVPGAADQVRPLWVGSQVPDVTFRTAEGKSFDLRNKVAKKPAVVIFYRGGWCPYCNTHLGEISSIESKLLAMGYQVLAVSPDRPEELSKSLKKHKINYELLSDSKMDAAKAFGIAFRLDGGTLKKYKQYNIDIEAASGQKHHLLPVPSVFIIGKDGTIHFQYVNPNYKVRLKKEVLLAAAKAYLK